MNETNLKYVTDGLTEAVEVVIYQTYDKSKDVLELAINYPRRDWRRVGEKFAVGLALKIIIAKNSDPAPLSSGERPPLYGAVSCVVSLWTQIR